MDGINAICTEIRKVSDIIWDFPTNLEWYRDIPVLGNVSFAILLLVGSGIFFTIRLRFIQVRKFTYGIRLLAHSRHSDTGISPLGAFFLSTAMRVGPGNILGVTGAIAAGGPGALFWMWVSAFFSMATAFTESTLAQLFKEKRVNDYVGGFAFYGRRLLGNSAAIGIMLSLLYVVYALLCLPAQGVRRGLMSNEAGQGTITMPAAASSVKHPCDEGCIQSVGVFLDTIVICTLSAFVVIMGRMWLTDSADVWFEMGKLPKFVASIGALSPDAGLRQIVSVTVSLCFGLFAFTCLLGFLSFTEICSARISTNRIFIGTVRLLCLAVIAFGILTSIAGLDLSALWNLSDLANIIMVSVNIPVLFVGFKYVLRAVRHFDSGDGSEFTSDTVGTELPVWKKKD